MTCQNSSNIIVVDGHDGLVGMGHLIGGGQIECNDDAAWL